jgi:hypothetical protein
VENPITISKLPLTQMIYPADLLQSWGKHTSHSFFQSAKQVRNCMSSTLRLTSV